MKNSVFFVVILAIFGLCFLGSELSAQTRQQTRQMNSLDREITRLSGDVRRLNLQRDGDSYVVLLQQKLENESRELRFDTLNPSSLRAYESAKQELANKRAQIINLEKSRLGVSKHNGEIDSKIAVVSSRLAQLEGARKTIFDSYTTTTGIPREMNQNTMRRRLQSNVIRREEASIDVLEHLPIYGDMVDTTVRFMAILSNNLIFDATFMVKPCNGGLPISITLAPGQNEEIFLIPGSYQVIMINNSSGRLICNVPLTISRVVHNYKGTECHGFAATPRW